MTNERPRLAPASDAATQWVRRGSVLVSLALAAWACVRYFSLPEVVPMQLIFFAVLQAVLLTGAVSWLIWVGLAGLFAVTLAGIVRMTRVA